jgi:hypothetical protein
LFYSPSIGGRDPGFYALCLQHDAATFRKSDFEKRFFVMGITSLAQPPH